MIRFRWMVAGSALVGLTLGPGCAGDSRGGDSDGGGVSPVPSEDTEGGSSSADGAGGDSGDGASGGTSGGSGADDSGGGVKFDLGGYPETSGAADGTGGECTIPEHVPCDDGTNDPFNAMGLGCAGELQVQSSTSGPGTAIGVRTGFGADGTFDPREGTAYAVIGSGLVSDLDNQTPNGDSNLSPTHCNDDIGGNDPGANLPAPLRVNDVAGDCTMNPALLGTGDCSNTVQGQFDQGAPFYANDYVEMRFDLDVPPDVISFSYDFAFFSTEWPDYYGEEFNDMYIGWLESEQWTGNISFDQNGNPISLNAGFLSIQDGGGNDPAFAGTCMRQHAGTGWLTTTAGVTPGESITVVFAIFDMYDSILDSYVFLDNFEWGCDPQSVPSTEPEG